MKTMTARVAGIEREDADVQELRLEGSPHPAICYKQLVGRCEPGDEVVANATATSLGLGTGGYDFVVCKTTGSADVENAAAPLVDTEGYASDGRIMKLRYTPMQCNVRCIEDQESPFHGMLENAAQLDGMPVVCCGLHSQLPPVAAGIRHVAPDARIVYCMTDEASLMLPFSNIARHSVETGLVNLCITCGQAMGGDAEAVTLHSALAAAHAVYDADVAIVAMGPGIAGTGTAMGHGGTAQAESVNAAFAIGGHPIAVVRLSFSDPRSRHRGVSHHFLEAMGTLALGRADVCLPAALEGTRLQDVLAALERREIMKRHDVMGIDAPLDQMDLRGIRVTTMGRSVEDDPWFFAAAFAAGIRAGQCMAAFGSEQAR